MELDCTDYESALNSTADILAISSKALTKCLEQLDGDSLFIHLETEDSPFESTSPLSRLNDRDFIGAMSSVIWFHATRINPCQSFDNGLLPTNQIAPNILRNLKDLGIKNRLFGESEWSNFERKGSMASRLAWKQSPRGQFDTGPSGSLTREIILKPEDSANRNYLDCPEFVFEYCMSLPEGIGSKLCSLFESETRPTIVKFRSRRKLSQNAIKAALFYVHAKIHNDPIRDCCSIGYCGDGIPVEKNDILEVDRLD